MNKRYCYVIVCTDGANAWSKVVASNGAGVEPTDYDSDVLANLLTNGWYPVRETAMSRCDDGSAYALVVLEKYEE